MVPALSADGVDMLLKEQHGVVLTRLCRLTRGTQGSGKLALRSAFHPTPKYRAGDQGQTPGSEFKSCPALPQPRTCFWTRQPACFRFFFSHCKLFETMTDVSWLLNESTGSWTYRCEWIQSPKAQSRARRHEGGGDGATGGGPNVAAVPAIALRSRRSPPRSRAV